MELFRRYTTTSEEYISVVINGYKHGTHYNLENKCIYVYLDGRVSTAIEYYNYNPLNTSYRVKYRKQDPYFLFWSDNGILECKVTSINGIHKGLMFTWNINREIRYVTYLNNVYSFSIYEKEN